MRIRVRGRADAVPANGTRRDTTPPSSVVIRSKFHPNGREYALRPLGELAFGELRALLDMRSVVAAFRSHASDKPTSSAHPLQNARVHRALDQAVAIIAPSIEPKVRRRLSDEQRCGLVLHWVDVSGAEA